MRSNISLNFLIRICAFIDKIIQNLDQRHLIFEICAQANEMLNSNSGVFQNSIEIYQTIGH
jgi:hypothetical protein